ncbi:Uncharacterized protein TCM_007518 [Theobroma cacao]|uniref:Uncharacterized protein n=1 Tax=Theobroma cacao TaxID=3641 RepID=A0A061E983_THECC|nr:Uncharacterized protein TCM_007518 [Theobroma cacao]
MFAMPCFGGNQPSSTERLSSRSNHLEVSAASRSYTSILNKHRIPSRVMGSISRPQVGLGSRLQKNLSAGR